MTRGKSWEGEDTCAGTWSAEGARSQRGLEVALTAGRLASEGSGLEARGWRSGTEDMHERAVV